MTDNVRDNSYVLQNFFELIKIEELPSKKNTSYQDVKNHKKIGNNIINEKFKMMQQLKKGFYQLYI